MIKVSCIVPTYNVEDYLEECINSLVNQTLKEIEIIIVNDGSTDKSLEIAKYMQEKYNNIIIIDKPNGGLSSARNEGTKAAKGEYITFIDSDDFIELNALEYMYNIGKSKNLDIIKGKYDLFDDKEKKIVNYTKNDIHIPSENKVITGIEYIIESIDYKTYEVIVCNTMFKRDYILINDLFFREGVKYEDHEFTLKSLICDKECRVIQIDKIFYFYRQRVGSITKVSNVDSIDDIVLSLDSMNKLINDKKTVYSSKYLYKVTSILVNTVYFQYEALNNKDKKYAKKILPKNIMNKVLFNSYSKSISFKSFIMMHTPYFINIKNIKEIYKRYV